MALILTVAISLSLSLSDNLCEIHCVTPRNR